MPLLRVVQSFPYHTSDAQGYAHAVPGQVIDVAGNVWQQLIDAGLCEAAGSEVQVEVHTAVHRVASAGVYAASYVIADPMVRR